MSCTGFFTQRKPASDNSRVAPVATEICMKPARIEKRSNGIKPKAGFLLILCMNDNSPILMNDRDKQSAAGPIRHFRYIFVKKPR